MLNLRKWGLATVCAIGSLSLQAQTPPQDEDIFILDAFIVDGSAQRGYVATTSMSGTRLAQLVRDVPIPIDIITEDFIRDTGALTVRDALQYTAGVETDVLAAQAGENPAVFQRNATSFRLRGFVSQAVLRHGFRREGGSDTINVTQVDVVRGPNALLYGIGNLGGVVNYVTRAPVDNLDFRSQLVVGSWGFRRVQADFNTPLFEGVNMRLPVMYQTTEGWQDHFEEDRWGIAPVFGITLGDRTRIQLEFDYFESSATQPENPLDETFLGRQDLPFLDQDTGVRPEAFTQGGFLAYPSRAFRFSGPDTTRDFEDIGALVLVNHAFSDQLAVSLGYYWSTNRRFEQRASPTLTAVPWEAATPQGRFLRQNVGWSFNPLHKEYDDRFADSSFGLQSQWNRLDVHRVRVQSRIEFLYQPDWFGLDHTLMVGLTRDVLRERPQAWKLLDQSGLGSEFGLGDSPGNNRERPFIHEAGRFTSPNPRFTSINDRDPIRFTREFYPGEDVDFFVSGFRSTTYRHEAIGSYLIHQTAFLDDRLRTIAGLRFDSYQLGDYRAGGNRFSRSDSERLLGDGDFSLAGTPAPVGKGPKTEEINFSFGASFSVTPDIAIFVLTASALDPEATGGQRLRDGLQAPPQSAQSYELGAKVDFLDGRISGSFSLYRVDRQDVVFGGSLPNAVIERLGIGQDIGPFIRDSAPPAPGEPDNRRPSAAAWHAQNRVPSNSITRDDRSEGFDAQVFFIDLVPNFETVLSFSYNHYRPLDAYFVVFQDFRDGPTPEQGEFIFERFAATEVEALDASNDSPYSAAAALGETNDQPRFSFRVWNKYTFREGPLDRLDIGVGVRWSDRRFAQFGLDQNTARVVADRLTLDMALGYEIEFPKGSLNLRLNISNLLNDDKVYGYALTEPRRWRLTASYRF
ncbi:MAG: TonB-dependent receptor [Opitutales bacterium]|nr:TonB-dependent receptor [Opitutales bacterium]